MGDFNLPDINWNTLTIEQHQNLKDIYEIFINTTQSLGLEQMIRKPTRLTYTLDLFLTNRPGLVVDYDIIIIYIYIYYIRTI